MTNKSTYIKLILATFFWGGTFIAGKTAAAEIGGIATAFYRFGLSTLFFLFLMTSQYKKWPKIKTIDYFKTFILGGFGIYLYSLLFYDGLQHITAGRAGIIVATNPVFTMLIASLFLGEKLNQNSLLGITLSFVGVIIVFYVKNGDHQPIGLDSFKGEWMMFGCVISWVAYTAISKSLIKKYNALQITSYACFSGTFLLLLHFLFVSTTPLTTPSLHSLLDLVYLSLFATVLGYIWYSEGIHHIGATRASQFINLVPVVSIILGYVLLKETMSPMQLVGSGLVIIGLLIANKKPKQMESNY